MNRPDIYAIQNRYSSTTPGYWQRSWYVRKREYEKMPEEWHLKQSIRESRIIRGPGEVGTPGCNPVMLIEAANNDDIDFVSHSKTDMDTLLRYVYELEGFLLDISQRLDRSIPDATRIKDVLTRA
ncbi:MAG: hypothetical protein WC822_06550, partial [Candidatus Paceibacterota bacterium]